MAREMERMILYRVTVVLQVIDVYKRQVKDKAYFSHNQLYYP